MVCVCVCLRRQGWVQPSPPHPPPEVPQPCTRAGCGNPPSMNASACALDAAAPHPLCSRKVLRLFLPQRWRILLPDGVLDLVLQSAGLGPWQPGHKGWQSHPGVGGAEGKLLMGIGLLWWRLLLFLCHRCWRGGREGRWGRGEG